MCLLTVSFLVFNLFLILFTEGHCIFKHVFFGSDVLVRYFWLNHLFYFSFTFVGRSDYELHMCYCRRYFSLSVSLAYSSYSLMQIFCDSIIRMIKLRRIWWTGHVVRTGLRGMHITFLWESQKKRLQWKPESRWLDNIIMNIER